MRTKKRTRTIVTLVLIICCIASNTNSYIVEDILIDPNQFRQLISDVLFHLSLDLGEPRIHSIAAVELLMLTAAHESHLGSYLEQVNGGHALGVFQIEKETYGDLYYNYLRFRPYTSEQISKYRSQNMKSETDLKGNILYQVAIARLLYWRISEPLPRFNDINGLAVYWKTHWNTNKGKGTVEKAVADYKRYVLDREV